MVTQPLWFIGIYLIVTALAPPMRALHRRFGVQVPMALIAGAVIVDVLRFAAGVPLIGFSTSGLSGSSLTNSASSTPTARWREPVHA